jgi:Ca-activated chloride channel homolog
MKLVWRRPHPFRTALLLLSFAVVAECVTAWPWSSAALDVVPYLDQETTPTQSQAPVLRSEVDLQTVDVQVKDKRGDDVLGLSAKDFSVREDGKPQKIAFFDSGGGRVSVVVLVDSSSSMAANERVGSAQAVAARFMRLGRPGDEIWAMDFTDRTGTFERLTAEQLLSGGAVTVAPASGSGSALYDAIAAALCHLRDSSNPRQAVIVVTDGVDEHSRISLEELIGLVRSSRAQLFMIAMQSRAGFHFGGHTQPKVSLLSGHDIDNPPVVFERLMKESGAESFIPNSASGLKEALNAVSNTLQSDYTLAFYPQQKTSAKLRKIEVKVDRRGAQVLARRFVSDQDVGDTVHFDPGTCTVSPQFHPYPFRSKLTQGPGGLVYRDDFSDPNSGWPRHPDSHYVSGGYEISTFEEEGSSIAPNPMMGEALGGLASPTTYRDNGIAAYGPSWRDFRASASIKAVLRPESAEASSRLTQAVHPAAGLVFRLSVKGYYALLVSGAPKANSLSFELVERNIEGASYSDTVLLPWKNVVQAPSSSAGTNVSVEDIGDRISAFVNDRLVGIARDGRLTNGYVGFIVSGPGRATFSNLLVEQK